LTLQDPVATRWLLFFLLKQHCFDFFFKKIDPADLMIWSKSGTRVLDKTRNPGLGPGRVLKLTEKTIQNIYIYLFLPKREGNWFREVIRQLFKYFFYNNKVKKKKNWV
jgi:hypothetical protein